MARLCVVVVVVVEREREKRERVRETLGRGGRGEGRPPRSCVSARGNTCHTCINNTQKSALQRGRPGRHVRGVVEG